LGFGTSIISFSPSSRIMHTPNFVVIFFSFTLFLATQNVQNCSNSFAVKYLGYTPPFLDLVGSTKYSTNSLKK
jgi:hypothetical protein